MNEDSFISPALTGDINERLEKRFADEAVRRQSFNEIENIAKILRIGKNLKFRRPNCCISSRTKVRWNCTG